MTIENNEIDVRKGIRYISKTKKRAKDRLLRDYLIGFYGKAFIISNA